MVSKKEARARARSATKWSQHRCCGDTYTQYRARGEEAHLTDPPRTDQGRRPGRGATGSTMVPYPLPSEDDFPQQISILVFASGLIIVPPLLMFSVDFQLNFKGCMLALAP